jgi:hypothetical protein
MLMTCVEPDGTVVQADHALYQNASFVSYRDRQFRRGHRFRRHYGRLTPCSQVATFPSS